MSRARLFAVALTIACTALHAAACSRGEGAAAEKPKQSDAEKYAQYMVSYPFGGQRPEWWEQAITDARPGGAAADPARHALLLDRAKKNGLVVSEGEGPVRVRPDTTLAAKLLERAGVK